MNHPSDHGSRRLPAGQQHSRRAFLGSAAAAALAAGLAGTRSTRLLAGAPQGAASARLTAAEISGASDGQGTLGSTFFATAFTEYAGTMATHSNGDLWPSCWADDGNIYAANGDGTGFSSGPEADVVVSRIMGTPETGISGQRLAAGADVANVWADPSQYNRKPTGMTCAGGVLYLAVQDLRTGPDVAFNDAPNASISRSQDHGLTWQKTTTPMFSDYRFTTVFFLDFGRDHAGAPAALGPADGNYVYAYGLDFNWRQSYSRTVPDPTDVYLARVRPGQVQNRSAWEFFTGMAAGRPVWSTDIAAKAPVLTDTRRVYPSLRNGGQFPFDLSVISQGSVVYLRGLDRYVYTSWTEYTFEFYEAPRPWGPWKLFFSHDAGGYPWFGASPGGSGCAGPKNGGYATTIPSKFISADGREMWVQSNWFVGLACGDNDYNFNLRKMRLAPFRPAGPDNRPDPADNIARTGQGVTPTEKSAHFGHWQFYNDGDRTLSEDSFDQADKPVDWWGYTFERSYHFDQVVYTTGSMFPDGGWFSDGLRVQVRQNFHWADVGGLRISPDYPFGNTAGPNRTFTMRFTPTWGDGIRIIGAPGGSAFFTSIAELEVYYTG